MLVCLCGLSPQPLNVCKIDLPLICAHFLQFTIGEGQVIKGWDQGLMDMSLGEKAKLDIAPFFAYGPQGSPPDIPPMSPLVFIVELRE